MGDPWGDLGALLGALGVLLGALGALLGALESFVFVCPSCELPVPLLRQVYKFGGSFFNRFFGAHLRSKNR